MNGSQEIHGGQGNQAAIKLGVAANHDVKIHDCKFSLLFGDAIASGTAEDYNIEIYNNTIDTAGHEKSVAPESIFFSTTRSLFPTVTLI